MTVCLSIFLLSTTPPKSFKRLWWNFVERLGIICNVIKNENNLITVELLKNEIIQPHGFTCHYFISSTSLNHSLVLWFWRNVVGRLGIECRYARSNTCIINVGALKKSIIRLKGYTQFVKCDTSWTAQGILWNFVLRFGINDHM